ncbi:MAG: hypothetical protein R2754_13780 [Microthrixaceae bacterium]
MGFLDKAKAMADQAMGSMDSTFSPEGEGARRGEQLFRDLGALTWAQQSGRAAESTAEEIQSILSELGQLDANRSLNVMRKHVHAGGTGAAAPPPPGMATHTAAGTAPPPPGGGAPPPGPGASAPPAPGAGTPQAPQAPQPPAQPQQAPSPPPPPPPPPGS